MLEYPNERVSPNERPNFCPNEWALPHSAKTRLLAGISPTEPRTSLEFKEKPFMQADAPYVQTDRHVRQRQHLFRTRLTTRAIPPTINEFKLS